MSSRRRVSFERSTWAGGQRRRSPRIFALDVWRKDFDSGSGGPESLDQKKEVKQRDIIKRKRHQDQSSDQKEDSKASRKPEKQVLQDILDTLQRRDTYEIFAEPVDPDEVVDYYEIIKEPMDFGTMRAKLHEGMYENLEQFKRDVFLITKNAMHFNSSSTIFFKQACGIDELARRVFHVIQTDPDNFEPEFSGIRRRSSRRPQFEAKVCRLSADDKPTKLTVDAPLKDTPRSFPNTSVIERNSSTRTPKPAIGASPSSTRINRARDGRRSNNTDTDRRCTYRPQSFYANNNDDLFDPTIFNSKLIHDQGFNYRESLLSFVEDLGPTAQMIAARKMQALQPNPHTFQNAASKNWFQATNCQVPSSNNWFQATINQVPTSNNWFQATNYQVPTKRAPDLSASHSMEASNSTVQSFKFADSLLGHCSILETIDFKADQRRERNAYVKGKRRTDDRLDYIETSSSLPTGTNVMGAPKRGRTTNDRLDYNEGSSLPTGTNFVGVPKRGRTTNDGLEYSEASSSIPTGTNVVNAPKRGRPIQNHKSREFCTSFASAKDLKPTSSMDEAGRLDEDVRPVILALEHSQANRSESKLKNKKIWTPPSSKASNLNGSRIDLSTRPMQEKKGDSSLFETRQSLLKPQPVVSPTPVSGFAFGMDFLKAKLNQMNNNPTYQCQPSFDGIGRGLIEAGGSYGYNNSYNGIWNNNYSCFRLQSETSSTKSLPINESMDSLDTKLALQL